MLLIGWKCSRVVGHVPALGVWNRKRRKVDGGKERYLSERGHEC